MCKVIHILLFDYMFISRTPKCPSLRSCSSSASSSSFVFSFPFSLNPYGGSNAWRGHMPAGCNNTRAGATMFS